MIKPPLIFSNVCAEFGIDAVIWPYRLYRLYRFISWIEETIFKPEVQALVKDSIRRVFVKRAPVGLPNDTVAEDRQTNRSIATSLLKVLNGGS